MSDIQPDANQQPSSARPPASQSPTRAVWTPPPGAPLNQQSFEPYQATPGLAAASPPAWSAPPAPKKSGNWKKVLLIVSLVIGLPLLGIGACGYWAYDQFTGPMSEANEVVGLIKDTRYDEAIEAIDPNCQGGADEFIEQAKSDPIDEFFFITFELAAGEVTEASVQGTVMFQQQGEVETRIELTPDGGDWRVCKIRLGVTFEDE